MTTAERNRRIEDLSIAQYLDALYYIRQGNSARAVAREVGITLKQANACFAVVYPK